MSPCLIHFLPPADVEWVCPHCGTTYYRDAWTGWPRHPSGACEFCVAEDLIAHDDHEAYS